jgi:hypothetical protein
VAHAQSAPLLVALRHLPPAPAEKMGLAPVRDLDDIRKLGEHVRERGFTG